MIPLAEMGEQEVGDMKKHLMTQKQQNPAKTNLQLAEKFKRGCQTCGKHNHSTGNHWFGPGPPPLNDFPGRGNDTFTLNIDYRSRSSPMHGRSRRGDQSKPYNKGPQEKRTKVWRAGMLQLWRSWIFRPKMPSEYPRKCSLGEQRTQ